MTKGERKKLEKQRERWAQEKKAFNRDLNALLLKHKAKIVARSHGGTYHYPTTVNLEAQIGKNSFDIGVENDEWDIITVNGSNTLATQEQDRNHHSPGETKMANAKQTKLQDFINTANSTGQINYDWGCEIYGFEDDHALVRCFDTNMSEQEQLEECITGKLYAHSDRLMAWSTDEDEEPIIFSARPWILVAMTYAGP